MATIHYDVRIQCVSDADYAEQLAAVQTVPGVKNLITNPTAKLITFELQHETGK